MLQQSNAVKLQKNVVDYKTSIVTRESGQRLNFHFGVNLTSHSDFFYSWTEQFLCCSVSLVQLNIEQTDMRVILIFSSNPPPPKKGIRIFSFQLLELSSFELKE